MVEEMIPIAGVHACRKIMKEYDTNEIVPKK